jgi:hypothetical protein
LLARSQFIESDEAVQLVMRDSNATDACVRLVNEAQKRWKHEEGTYRDDITAIVAMLPLPFLELTDEDEGSFIQINKGRAGVSKLPASPSAAPRAGAPAASATSPASGRAARMNRMGSSADAGDGTFAARRLSVNEFDPDDADLVDDEEESGVIP